MKNVDLAPELVFIGGLVLPNIFENRAQWARDQYIKKPQETQVCNQNLIWAFNKSDGFWYSIAGNYSSIEPKEKIRREAEREKEEECRLETVLEIYNRTVYESHIRQYVLERDEYQCQMCGKCAPTKLHVHHILKRKEGGTDHFDNLITVCPSCHSKADRKLYNPDWVNPREEVA